MLNQSLVAQFRHTLNICPEDRLTTNLERHPNGIKEMYLFQKILVHKTFELLNSVMKKKKSIHFVLPQFGLKPFQHFEAAEIYAKPYKRN